MVQYKLSSKLGIAKLLIYNKNKFACTSSIQKLMKAAES